MTSQADPTGGKPRSSIPDKNPFEVARAIDLLRTAVAPFPKAALFELYAEGHTSVFELLIACVLSIRTRDETTLPTARALFARAPGPQALAELSEEEIDQVIAACTFHEGKARTIQTIARRTVVEFGGALPGDPALLQTFHGVGPKCANLAVGIACRLPLIGVDVHVHRITNRWGLVATRTPEQTMEALTTRLPRDYWVEINALLVPFGKHVCTSTNPKCSTCPLLDMCQQVGVTKHK
jgi:endonuclease-3